MQSRAGHPSYKYTQNFTRISFIRSGIEEKIKFIVVRKQSYLQPKDE